MSENTIRSKLADNANRSVLSLTSPAKLNVISSDWSKITNHTMKSSDKVQKKRPSSSGGSVTLSNVTNIASSNFTTVKSTKIQHVPLLRRSSSFFKDEIVENSSGDGRQRQRGESSTSESAVSTDRFIPIRSSSSSTVRLDHDRLEETEAEAEDVAPPPYASPTTHLRAQTKLVFKQNVAQACGLDMNQRILQYLPRPPVASFKRKAYSLGNRAHYYYGSQTGERKPWEVAKLRKINTNPERILDAPGFQDDFYLNLLSWSKKNCLAIALESSLYLWNGESGDVTLLTEFEAETISSVTWSDDDCHVSIGKSDGNTEIWDVETMSLVRTMRSGLGVRIGSQSWLDTLVACGTKSGEIQINDVRIKNHIVSAWQEHSGEVCGLSYRKDGLQLASGSNDNSVMIWDTRTSMPQFVKRNHTAAVKAISWCPDVPNLLATGGGQTDKYIHFWNTTTGARVSSINTGSQVSSLQWGQSYNGDIMNREIVATGGNPENAISVYNYETRFKVAEIVQAHDSRICSSQLSPDGTTLATVGGDENLKFYKVFDPKRRSKAGSDAFLDLLSVGSKKCDSDNARSRSPTRRNTSEYVIR